MRGRMQAGALHATIPVTNLLLLLRLKPRQGSVSGRGSLFLSRGAINGNKKKAYPTNWLFTTNIIVRQDVRQCNVIAVPGLWAG